MNDAGSKLDIKNNGKLWQEFHTDVKLEKRVYMHDDQYISTCDMPTNTSEKPIQNEVSEMSVSEKQSQEEFSRNCDLLSRIGVQHIFDLLVSLVSPDLFMNLLTKRIITEYIIDNNHRRNAGYGCSNSANINRLNISCLDTVTCSNNSADSKIYQLLQRKPLSATNYLNITPIVDSKGGAVKIFQSSEKFMRNDKSFITKYDNKSGLKYLVSNANTTRHTSYLSQSAAISLNGSCLVTRVVSTTDENTCNDVVQKASNLKFTYSASTAPLPSNYPGLSANLLTTNRDYYTNRSKESSNTMYELSVTPPRRRRSDNQELEGMKIERSLWSNPIPDDYRKSPIASKQKVNQSTTNEETLLSKSTVMHADQVSGPKDDRQKGKKQQSPYSVTLVTDVSTSSDFEGSTSSASLDVTTEVTTTGNTIGSSTGTNTYTSTAENIHGDQITMTPTQYQMSFPMRQTRNRQDPRTVDRVNRYIPNHLTRVQHSKSGITNRQDVPYPESEFVNTKLGKVGLNRVVNPNQHKLHLRYDTPPTSPEGYITEPWNSIDLVISHDKLSNTIEVDTEYSVNRNFLCQAVSSTTNVQDEIQASLISPTMSSPTSSGSRERQRQAPNQRNMYRNEQEQNILNRQQFKQTDSRMYHAKVNVENIYNERLTNLDPLRPEDIPPATRRGQQGMDGCSQQSYVYQPRRNIDRLQRTNIYAQNMVNDFPNVNRNPESKQLHYCARTSVSEPAGISNLRRNIEIQQQESESVRPINEVPDVFSFRLKQRQNYTTDDSYVRTGGINEHERSQQINRNVYRESPQPRVHAQTRIATSFNTTPSMNRQQVYHDNDESRIITQVSGQEPQLIYSQDQRTPRIAEGLRTIQINETQQQLDNRRMLNSPAVASQVKIRVAVNVNLGDGGMVAENHISPNPEVAKNRPHVSPKYTNRSEGTSTNELHTVAQRNMTQTKNVIYTTEVCYPKDDDVDVSFGNLPRGATTQKRCKNKDEECVVVSWNEENIDNLTQKVTVKYNKAIPIHPFNGRLNQTPETVGTNIAQDLNYIHLTPYSMKSAKMSEQKDETRFAQERNDQVRNDQIKLTKQVHKYGNDNYKPTISLTWSGVVRTQQVPSEQVLSTTPRSNSPASNQTPSSFRRDRTISKSSESSSASHKNRRLNVQQDDFSSYSLFLDNPKSVSVSWSGTFSLSGTTATGEQRVLRQGDYSPNVTERQDKANLHISHRYNTPDGTKSVPLKPDKKMSDSKPKKSKASDKKDRRSPSPIGSSKSHTGSHKSKGSQMSKDSQRSTASTEKTSSKNKETEEDGDVEQFVCSMHNAEGVNTQRNRIPNCSVCDVLPTFEKLLLMEIKKLLREGAQSDAIMQHCQGLMYTLGKRILKIDPQIFNISNMWSGTENRQNSNNENLLIDAFLRNFDSLNNCGAHNRCCFSCPCRV